MSGEAFGIEAAAAQPQELDSRTFDLDAWIDGVVTRPTEVVRLYGKGHLNERLKELEREIALARNVPAEERGITDATPDSLQEQWDEVAAELVASALPLKVQALTSDEIEAAKKEGQRAKASEVEQQLYVIAAASVEPKVTAAQLIRLRQRGGDANLTEALLVVMRLSNNTVRPTAPFSRKPSGGGRG